MPGVHRKNPYPFLFDNSGFIIVRSASEGKIDIDL